MASALAYSQRVHIAFALTWLFSPLGVRAQVATPGYDTAARAAARQVGEEGIEAYWARNYVEAHEKFEKGYQLFATPTLGLWSARARMQLGRWVDAAERYRETLTMSNSVGNQAAQNEALHDAKKELEALLPRIPTVTLQLEGASSSEVKLALDGSALPNAFIGVARPTDPGSHELVALRNDERVVVRVQLAEREHKSLPLRFSELQADAVSAQPPAASPPGTALDLHPEARPNAITTQGTRTTQGTSSPLVPVGIATLALGGVGLATAVVTYAVALGTCPDATCGSRSSQSKYDTLQGVSTWTFWPGAALAVGGLASVWFGLRASSEPEHMRLRVGPGGLSVRGAF